MAWIFVAGAAVGMWLSRDPEPERWHEREWADWEWDQWEAEQEEWRRWHDRQYPYYNHWPSPGTVFAPRRLVIYGGTGSSHDEADAAVTGGTGES
jgi:hypothetical protein